MVQWCNKNLIIKDYKISKYYILINICLYYTNGQIFVYVFRRFQSRHFRYYDTFENRNFTSTSLVVTYYGVNIIYVCIVANTCKQVGAMTLSKVWDINSMLINRKIRNLNSRKSANILVPIFNIMYYYNSFYFIIYKLFKNFNKLKILMTHQQYNWSTYNKYL